MKDLVLLHGWGIPKAAFGALSQPLLGAGCALVALDLPGYNGVNAPEPYTLEALSGDLASRAPARCAVLGWSLGGLVALAWAAAVPAQVQALVIVAGTPCFVRKADWPHGIGPDVLQSFALALRLDRDRTLRRFAGLAAHGDADARTVTRVLHEASGGPCIAPEHVLEAGLRILLESDLRALLPRIGQRTLVIHGERDGLAPIGAAAYMAAMLPHAELDTVKDAGHAPFVTHADHVAQRIVQFLYD